MKLINKEHFDCYSLVFMYKFIFSDQLVFFLPHLSKKIKNRQFWLMEKWVGSSGIRPGSGSVCDRLRIGNCGFKLHSILD